MAVLPGSRHLRRLTSWGAASIVLMGVVSCQGRQPGAQQGPPALPVDVTKATLETVNDLTEYLGALEATEQTILRPQIQGRIVSVAVQPGQTVTVGQPMFVLDSEQVEADVAAAQAEVARQEAQLRDAKITFERQKFLADQGVVPLQNLDNARRDLETAQAQLKAARENAVAKSVNVQYKTVRAPINGLVGDIRLKVGDFVETGDELTTITVNNQLFINIPVPTTRIPQLRKGQPVKLLDPFSKRILATGAVDFVSPVVQENLQTVLVKVVVPNPDGLIRNGQIVQAEIVWDRKDAVLVPTQAVSPLAGVNFVYVVEPKPNSPGQFQVRQQKVELGSIFNNRYQIRAGLKPGETVATTNLLSLTDKAAVQPQTTNTAR
ncbi:efflux RND transporter periplasmic adaptor subunit [Synechococcus elongatus]|uniref:Efflux RND transporter periplasmic adaptor subunit n=2 Tax=Synechococcus elongatus TaxID=32046 RepID=A0AAN1QMW4_SYNEL|nr:efflux RND transporter periplasmic adaptor subunit [Synechococcus elongatus]AZB72199.1 efflux RND transporter periplasmic adaptor subunit [Synechococcus elongatus PCC 11801]QFZ91898.1 efflux RND transporter periplasmic adaptor subunit [Synechococcus elongatus PCC 11802]